MKLENYQNKSFIATIATEGYSRSLASPTPEHRGGFIGDDTKSPCTNSRCPTRRTSKRKRTESLTNYCKACAPKYVPSAGGRTRWHKVGSNSTSASLIPLSLPFQAFIRFVQQTPGPEKKKGRPPIEQEAQQDRATAREDAELGDACALSSADLSPYRLAAHVTIIWRLTTTSHRFLRNNLDVVFL